MFKRICFGLMLVAPVFAVAQEKLIPIITNVQETAGGTQLTINGTGFGTVRPQVTLSGEQLTVLNSTDTKVTVTLPAGIIPGSYLVTLVNERTRLPAVFSALVGSVQGPAGPPGVPGPAGAAGAQGPIGLTGPAGPKGAAGVQGPQGSQGSPGPQGPIGPAGPTGATGKTGATGAQGPIGLTGAIGPKGAAGPQGLQGLPGAIGPVGPTGAPGAQGPAGPTGAPGPIGETGAQGPQGIPGQTGPAGIPGPAGMALPHVIIVPATSDPVANGVALQNAVNTITAASAASPYVIQLDAGTYTFTDLLSLPLYVSLRGQGAESTSLIGQQSSGSQSMPSVDFGDSGTDIASVSALTIGANLTLSSSGSTFTIRAMTQSAGYMVTTSTSDTPVTLSVYDSVIPAFQALTSADSGGGNRGGGDGQQAVNGLFVGSEVDFFTGGSVFTCVASYAITAGQLYQYSSSCD